ncbi:hypothetical protein GCM10010301_71740 [Streptomyces plicatus]|nr:hypothetical protein GCM10010301_71740 [Streptomyces plicatus]
MRNTVSAGVGHLANPQQPDHVFVAVAAVVIAAPLGLGGQTDLVVVTDRPPRGAGELWVVTPRADRTVQIVN